MAARFAEPLAALLLEHAQLGAARLAVDHTDDLGVAHERGTGDDIAPLPLDEQHLVERELGAGLARPAVDLHDLVFGDLQLPATSLNNRVHERYLRWMGRNSPDKGLILAAKRT